MHGRQHGQRLDMHYPGLLDCLTNAEEGREGNALPPPVRQPQEAPGERGLPRRRQGHEAQEVGRDQGLDRCAEGEEKRAKEDVPDHVAGGPEWIFSQKMPGNSIMDLLQRNRGRNEGAGEPIPRVSIVICQGPTAVGSCHMSGRTTRRRHRAASRGARSMVALTAPRTQDRS